MEKRTDQRVFWHGKLKKESRKTWQATALTALCSVALFCLLFSYKKMYPFGDGSVAITDLYSQYLPLLYHFYDVVTGQKNLFLDFSVSSGANLYADTINEVLNPFNYVLLLFGRDQNLSGGQCAGAALQHCIGGYSAYFSGKNSIGQTLSECCARPLLRVLRVHGI